MRRLSVIIPARNEMFLRRTVEDVLSASTDDTDIVAIVDGPTEYELPEPGDRVKVIVLQTPIGQRAATNLGVRQSSSEYVMKLDAHCSMQYGFDTTLLNDTQPDWTIVPAMHNLHAFDWVCDICGRRRYQGPSGPCEWCGGPTKRDIVWRSKPSPVSTAMRFDRDLKFQYWPEYKKRQQGALVETMSILGACWMVSRERYIALDMSDERHGSWGQQGTEVACKTWLSGGRLIVDKNTSFAHMFRTQGKDFGFPYPISNEDVERARAYSRSLWLNDQWPHAVHSLQWLIDRFAPVPGWHTAEPQRKAILYYTDNRLNDRIAAACMRQLEKSGLPIVSVSLKPLNFGKNIVVNRERGIETMFIQILTGLEAIEQEIVFCAEHDVLYHPSHFSFIPPTTDRYYYNENVWRVNAETGHALFHYAKSTSQLCAYRDLLLKHYTKRVSIVAEHGFTRRMGFEPGTHNREERVDDYKCDAWMSEVPNIDIRHDKNLTPSRWSKEQFRNQVYTRGWTESDSVPGWGKTEGRFDQFLSEI